MKMSLSQTYQRQVIGLVTVKPKHPTLKSSYYSNQ
jgi:hypothetical protein